MKKNYFGKFILLICFLCLSLTVQAYHNYVSRISTPTPTVNSSIYYGAISDYASFVETELAPVVSSKNLVTKSLESTLAVEYVAGDYRSVGSGDWTNLSTWEYFDGTNWGNATSYPGEFTGTNNVTIASGDTVSITSNLTTEVMGDFFVEGTLILGDGTSSQHYTTLSTDLITITSTGTITFDGNKVRLTLPDPNAALLIETPGMIDGSCSNNDEIFINTNKYATCVGSGSTTYSFGDLIAAGGTFNAVITPSTNPFTAEACTNFTLTGSTTGTTTGTVTYSWTLTDTDISDNSTTTTNLGSSPSASFIPQIGYEYLVSLEVADNTYTNVETLTVYTVDTTPPT
ncbi:hypothetical protein, partial [Gaetbulibacter saemankumensis]|uniref:hypothetical protein n=1 Tax=Gaetbulibacter saemankumensis TaxID=311208 RepID=UPI0012FAAA13